MRNRSKIPGVGRFFCRNRLPCFLFRFPFPWGLTGQQRFHFKLPFSLAERASFCNVIFASILPSHTPRAMYYRSISLKNRHVSFIVASMPKLAQHTPSYRFRAAFAYSSMSRSVAARQAVVACLSVATLLAANGAAEAGVVSKYVGSNSGDSSYTPSLGGRPYVVSKPRNDLFRRGRGTPESTLHGRKDVTSNARPAVHKSLACGLSSL